MPGAFAWIGVVLAGTAAGLIPFFVAQSRGNARLAWGSLVACLPVGVLGGALFAAPLSVVLTIVALNRSGPLDPPKPVNYWAIAVPAALLIWLAALGMVAASLPPKYISGKITVPLTLIAMVFGGYIASAVTWFANRAARETDSSDLASRISSIGENRDP